MGLKKKVTVSKDREPDTMRILERFRDALAPRLWSSIWLVLVLAVIALACNSSSTQTSSQNPAKPPASESQPPPIVKRPDIGFGSDQKLIDHYQKHAQEFGSIGMKEYLRRAQELRDRPADGNLLETIRPDGVISRFDRASGAFIAFNRDGVIRTFFRPNEGEAYFWRQARRKH